MRNPIESLETRQHLSVTLSKGVLTLTGTAGVDAISITQTGTSVVAKVNATTRTFALASVKGLTVNALGGNDVVSIASNFTRPTVVEGGAGNDKITGGGGAETLIGGAGRDSLHGNAGNDLLSGGSGNDLLEGLTGDDRLIGGDGNDLLRGGLGANLLLGGLGGDTVVGPTGKDTVQDPNVNPLPPVDETFIYYDFDENWVLTRYDISLGQVPPSWTRLPPIDPAPIK